MNSCRKMRFAVLFTLVLFLLISTSASAQGPADPAVATPATTADATAGPDAPAPAAPANPVPQLGGANNYGDSWRVGISIYGWFPGTHGTVGVLGHDASANASFSDIFHTLKGIIPIAVEADKGRFVMPIDYLWMKLGYDKQIPFDDLNQTSINVHLTQSIFTPKLGYRVVDGEHLKVDVLGGIRYWYLGQDTTLGTFGARLLKVSQLGRRPGRRQVHPAFGRKGSGDGGR